VVASAPDGSSHNIYLYGGDVGRDSLSDVWVLSIPSFKWILISNNSADSRARHTCMKVHEHYMFSYRGVSKYRDCPEYGGIRFLDLNTGEFRTHVEIGGSYTVPQKVYTVIGGDKLGNAKIVTPSDPSFDDYYLRKLFEDSRANTTIASLNTTIASPSVTSTGNSTLNPYNTSSKPNKKTIILISTLIPILALIAGFILAFGPWRRQRIKQREHVIPELHAPNAGPVTELPASKAGRVSELPAPNAERVELSAPGPRM